MDCERCELLLLEYVSGELAESEGAELRAALETCEHCRHALEKLERGHALASAMPVVEPPPAIFAAVMRAAEARAAELAKEHAAARAPEPAPPERPPVREAEESPLDGVWKWLAGLLHGPQFAMAALLVLMVGVGLWWVPALSGPRPIAPPLVSDTPAATTASGPLAPAEVPHLEIDPRTGRVELGDDEGRSAADRVEHVAAAEVAAVPEIAEDTERPMLLEDPAGERDREAGGEVLAAAATLELGAGDSVGGRTEEDALPSIAPPSTAPGTAIAPSPLPPIAPSAGSGERVARSGERLTAPSTTPDEVPPPAFDDSTLPTSMLAQARALVLAGSLLEATRAYERLLSAHPDFGSAPRAMIELAEVFRRRGNIASARRWLTRAEGYGSVAADARRELARLDAMDRAASMDMPAGDEAGAMTESAEPPE